MLPCYALYSVYQSQWYCMCLICKQGLTFYRYNTVNQNLLNITRSLCKSAHVSVIQARVANLTHTHSWLADVPDAEWGSMSGHEQGVFCGLLHPPPQTSTKTRVFLLLVLCLSLTSCIFCQVTSASIHFFLRNVVCLCRLAYD